MTTTHTIHRSDLAPGDTMDAFRQRVDEIVATPQWEPLVMEWETQPEDSPWSCTVHVTAYGNTPTAKDLAFAALHVAGAAS